MSNYLPDSTALLSLEPSWSCPFCMCGQQTGCESPASNLHWETPCSPSSLLTGVDLCTWRASCQSGLSAPAATACLGGLSGCRVWGCTMVKWTGQGQPTAANHSPLICRWSSGGFGLLLTPTKGNGLFGSGGFHNLISVLSLSKCLCAAVEDVIQGS